MGAGQGSASWWASPTATGDRIYFFTKEGKTVDGATRVYGVATVDGAFLIVQGQRYGAQGIRGGEKSILLVSHKSGGTKAH